MHRTALPLCWFLFLSMLTARHVAAHCEVPCGIYDDQARFQQMLEDTKTIAKASDQIHLLATESSPQNMNQLVRWVTTKEQHATNIQQTISQYFMTQRIKADKPEYVNKLTTAHAVMVAAMKCKQKVSPDAAEALEKSIYKFYTAYTGKKPEIHKHN
ncbi:MAG: superoxide dismutase, Ni [Pirellulales bacterium]|jgi:nickel superoxide dismutase|nr:superoxide dismutase, Ni [Pirellulales bacterium]